MAFFFQVSRELLLRSTNSNKWCTTRSCDPQVQLSPFLIKGPGDSLRVVDSTRHRRRWFTNKKKPQQRRRQRAARMLDPNQSSMSRLRAVIQTVCPTLFAHRLPVCIFIAASAREDCVLISSQKGKKQKEEKDLSPGPLGSVVLLLHRNWTVCVCVC